MYISIVVPVYNSTNTLITLADEVFALERAISCQFGIVFVDDGSQAETWRALQEVRQKYPAKVKIYRLMRNFGQHNALMCGLKHADGDYVITMDDDLQNPPSEVPKLIDAMVHKNYDLVYGCFDKKKHHWFRNLGSKCAVALYKKALDIDVTPTAFRIMSHNLVKSLTEYQQNFVYLDGLLAWNTKSIGSVLVRHAERAEGRSGYSIRKLARLASHLVVNFTTLPLRMVFTVGMLSALLGFVFGLYIFLKYFFLEQAVPGYTSLVCIVTFFGGVQLIVLGVIGEYLGRIISSINTKPQYVIRTSLE